MKFGRACSPGVSVPSSPAVPHGLKRRPLRALCSGHVGWLLLLLATGCSGSTTTTGPSTKQEKPGEDGNIPVLPPDEGFATTRWRQAS